ncbi:MAG: hypothetical protein ACRDOK_07440 [Streptosporangiaceae bacterium]
MTALRSSGTDLVLGRQTRYALIFQAADAVLPFGSRPSAMTERVAAWGLAGPVDRLNFGYVALRFRPMAGPSLPAYAVLRTVQECARSAT